MVNPNFMLSPGLPVETLGGMVCHMLSRDEVLKIARLARLELNEDEITLYQNRLGRVLEYIDELSKVETPKDAFVRHVPKDALNTREDVAQPFGQQEALLRNAPAAEEKCFLLPTVVDHE